MDISRYTDTTELKFDVEFVTPTFLGGADGNAEIRTAPFKYGIRYWWRVLYGAKYFEQNKLKETEDLIFGSTEQKSMLDISIENMLSSNSITGNNGFPNGRRIGVEHQGRVMRMNILDYLAYGKYKYISGEGNSYISTYIKPKTKVTIKITIKNCVNLNEITDAIRFFILYGGIGSKSRNGFGSMYTAGLKNITFSKNVVMSKNLWEFPAFSEYSKFFRTKQYFGTWEEALSEIGYIYRQARCSLENRHFYEKRGFVARPIEVKGERNIPLEVKSGRIPKPFYLGIMKIDDKKYLGYILCFPVLFYEKQKQQSYIEVINSMQGYFSKFLKDDTAKFFSEITGVGK